MPESERALYGQQPSSIRDAAKRREVKIRQYRAEKDLRSHIEVIRRSRRQSVSADRLSGDFDLVASLLLPSEDDAEDVETENILRDATLLLLRLFYAQACTQLEGVDQEVLLLRNAPPSSPPPKPPLDERRNKTEDEDMWKIETIPESSDRGPLLDPHGKVGPSVGITTNIPDLTAAFAAIYYLAYERVGPYPPACTGFWAWPPSTDNDRRRVLGYRAAARGNPSHRRVSPT